MDKVKNRSNHPDSSRYCRTTGDLLHPLLHIRAKEPDKQMQQMINPSSLLCYRSAPSAGRAFQLRGRARLPAHPCYVATQDPTARLPQPAYQTKSVGSELCLQISCLASRFSSSMVYYLSVVFYPSCIPEAFENGANLENKRWASWYFVETSPGSRQPTLIMPVTYTR